MKTLIRLLRWEQSDLGLHCLPRPIFSENLGSLRYTYIFLSVNIVRQRNSIFLEKRAIASIENVFVYSDRYGHSDL